MPQLGSENRSGLHFLIFWSWHSSQNRNLRLTYRAQSSATKLPQTRHVNRNSGGNYWCTLITLYEMLRTKSAYVAQPANLTWWKSEVNIDPLTTSRERSVRYWCPQETLSPQGVYHREQTGQRPNTILTLRQSIREPQNQNIPRIYYLVQTPT